MDTAAQSRLEKLLGMLGSAFDGERANAARMIAAMAEREGKTIAEMVLGARAQAHSFRREPPRPERSDPERPRREKPARGGAKVVIEALRDAAACGDELEFVITPWEAEFAADVSERYTFDYELSEKQLVVAQKIVDKVLRHRSRGGAA